MERQLIRDIAKNGIIAALYVVITVLTPAISYLGVQVRLAEMLILLVFFNRKYSFGMILGCLIANIFSPLGWPDIVFGTLATALSCLGICFMKHLFLATLFPVILNGIIVGAELAIIFPAVEHGFWIEFLIQGGLVALGEVIAICIIGYIFFMLLGKRKYFQEIIDANRNLDFKW